MKTGRGNLPGVFLNEVSTRPIHNSPNDSHCWEFQVPTNWSDRVLKRRIPKGKRSCKDGTWKRIPVLSASLIRLPRSSTSTSLSFFPHLIQMKWMATLCIHITVAYPYSPRLTKLFIPYSRPGHGHPLHTHSAHHTRTHTSNSSTRLLNSSRTTPLHFSTKNFADREQCIGIGLFLFLTHRSLPSAQFRGK